jgi:predicted dehydrogenase
MTDSDIYTLRLGVIGVGGMGASHVAAIKATEGLELVAAADTNTEALERAVAHTEALAFADYTQMLDEVEMDGLVAILPHHLHADVVARACQLGLPLLKEKPLARNMAEARQFVQAADDAGIILMLATQRRYTPAYASLKDIAASLGHIFLARGQYVFRWGRDFAWRGQWETAGGGALHDMGYHTIDMLNWYLGLPDWVSAEWSAAAFPQREYKTDDTAVTMFGYDSGTMGYLLTTWATGPPEEAFYLHGTEGWARADRSGITHCDVEGNVISDTPAEADTGVAMRNQVAHFADCIRHNREPLSSARVNLLNMAFIEAAYRSAAEEARLDPRTFLSTEVDVL